MARNFNQLLGYAWDGNLHLNNYLIGIGLGAGLGAYVAWMNLTSRWYLLGASVLLAVLGGIVGTYLGAEYGQNIESTYLRQRATIVNNSHWGQLSEESPLPLASECSTTYEPRADSSF